MVVCVEALAQWGGIVFEHPILSHQCFNDTFITGLPQQVRPARLLSYLDFAE